MDIWLSTMLESDIGLYQYVILLCNIAIAFSALIATGSYLASIITPYLVRVHGGSDAISIIKEYGNAYNNVSMQCNSSRKCFDEGDTRQAEKYVELSNQYDTDRWAIFEAFGVEFGDTKYLRECPDNNANGKLDRFIQENPLPKRSNIITRFIRHRAHMMKKNDNNVSKMYLSRSNSKLSI